MEYEHLNENIRPYMALSDEERIKAIRTPRWIHYDAARNILGQLEDLLRWPKVGRMPNYLIIGDTNNGKSMLLQHFVDNNPPFCADEEMIELEVPVVYTQAPTKPSEAGLYSAILDGIGAIHNPRASSLALQKQVTDTLSRLNTKVLIIDELHNLIAGSQQATKQCMIVIKWLANELRIPIVGAGIQSAITAIRYDDQLANRFRILKLNKWTKDKDFVRLLKAFEGLIPLKHKAELATPEAAQLILNKTDGLLGEMANLFQEAAVKAICNRKEKIDLSAITTINWESPTERRAYR